MSWECQGWAAGRDTGGDLETRACQAWSKRWGTEGESKKLCYLNLVEI